MRKKATSTVALEAYKMDVVEFDLSHLPEKEEKLSLALGNFDGCHKGHQKLFIETALGSSGTSAALLFDEPFGHGPFLSSIEDKKRYCFSSRLERLYILKNARDVYSFSPEEFIEKVLLPLGTSRVVIGSDFRFGSGASGGVEELKRHFDVDVVPLLCEGENKVASTAIRSYLSEGDLQKANAMLGRPYEVMGIVAEGLHNGEKIGYKTCNIHLDFPYVLPLSGVYAGMVYLYGKAYRAMINVGTNPTVGVLSRPLVEVHVLDFDEDCYGARAYVRFLSFVRKEIRFESLDALRGQLKKDEREIRDILA